MVRDTERLGREKRVTLTHLTINGEGWVQLAGNDSCVESLYASFSAMVRGTIESQNLNRFLSTLVYRSLV